MKDHRELAKDLAALLRRCWIVGITMVLLVLARVDMGAGGAILMVTVFTAFIFAEFHFIRTTLIRVYADALTEQKVLLYFLRAHILNVILSGIISIYLAFYLYIFVNLSTWTELLFFVLVGVLISLLYSPTKRAADGVVKERPAKVFAPVGLIFLVVLVTVILDGLYNAFAPIDPRITQPFDINIPLYVIEDIKHSYAHLQHFLRTALYLKYNIQSIGLSDDVGSWFPTIRFILLLSPTPYIAYALFSLSFLAIKKFHVVTER